MRLKIAKIAPSTGSNFSYNLEKWELTDLQYNKENIAKSSSSDQAWENIIEKEWRLDTFDYIIIDPNCEISDALSCIFHIRLGDLSFQKPILWLSPKDYNIVSTELDQKIYIPNIFTYFIEVIGYEESTLYELIESWIAKVERSDKDDWLKGIQVLSPISKPHQITNEWGAYLLAKSIGEEQILQEIPSFQNRAGELYFKYLKSKNKLPNVSSDILSQSIKLDNPINALLIDDNAEKGWFKTVASILKKQNEVSSLESFGDRKFFIENEVSYIIESIIIELKAKEYQVVFLDLRLKEEEGNESFQRAEISEFSGGKILKEIKKEFPYLPVIIFTASNKAWNMEQLLNAGADGYFIKPSPEVNINANQLANEVNAFFELIKDCQKKYFRLFPFWEKINKIILERTLIEEREINGKETVVEKRIIERLRMFFGLLKRSFEDSKFNTSNFYYSDIKLAFMTLWSCLNDIQFIYYDKSEEHNDMVNSRGEKKYNIKICQYLLENKLNLPAYENYDYYLQYRASGNKFSTKLNVDYSQDEVYTLLATRENPKRGINFSVRIGEQIAFLLLSFGRGRPGDDSEGKVNSEYLTRALFRLKNKRNHLYLTHGDESPSSEFFVKEEKDEDEDEISLTDCAELLEIIFFLLKGVYVKVDTSKF